MWEPAFAAALAIFLTCTLFFTIYGLAYLGVMKSADAIDKIKKKLKEEECD